MNENLETRVEVLTERVSTMLDRMEEDRRDNHELEKRVAKLENSRAYILGAGAAGGAMAGWLGDLILHALTK